jgi:hypothetical protein
LNSDTKGKTYVGGVQKQGIEERAWTQEGRNKRTLDRRVYNKLFHSSTVRMLR